MFVVNPGMPAAAWRMAVTVTKQGQDLPAGFNGEAGIWQRAFG